MGNRNPSKTCLEPPPLDTMAEDPKSFQLLGKYFQKHGILSIPLLLVIGRFCGSCSMAL